MSLVRQIIGEEIEPEDVEIGTHTVRFMVVWNDGTSPGIFKLVVPNNVDDKEAVRQFRSLYMDHGDRIVPAPEERVVHLPT